MKIKATTFMEHQSSGKQDVVIWSISGAPLLAPGGSTTCWGSTCSTCCAAFSPNGGDFSNENEGYNDSSLARS